MKEDYEVIMELERIATCVGYAMVAVGIAMLIAKVL